MAGLIKRMDWAMAIALSIKASDSNHNWFNLFVKFGESFWQLAFFLFNVVYTTRTQG